MTVEKFWQASHLPLSYQQAPDLGEVKVIPF